jgi:hypothetical protein
VGDMGGAVERLTRLVEADDRYNIPFTELRERGEAGPSTIGSPHDAMYPLHRFVHWMAHEDGCVS